ncbi:MAG: FG-GAP-like repeat-containing protein [Polyangia bacterium]|jgi:cysteine-rich repeat protein|nr:FG-GAP-like repeat-containing protein [Polyangia bacterium]
MTPRIPPTGPALALSRLVLSSSALAVALAWGCNPTPPLPEGPCGNGELNRGEGCDNGVLNSDVAPNACRSNCQKAHCGDQVIDSTEECDSENLAGKSCLDFGFDGGSLICDYASCMFLTRHCTLCGDDLQEGAEECDGADLAGLTCSNLGFGGGTLDCAASCLFDFGACTDGCGNSVREGTEECDGPDLGETSCQEMGFEGGNLACTQDCRLDRRGCVGGCGNGVVEPGETCDDGNDVPGDGCTDCRAGDGTFEVGVPLPTGIFPTALRLSDMDGDGLADLVVGYAGESPLWGGVSVHRNLGNRAFGPAAPTPLGTRVSALAVSDLDQDGQADVAATFLGDPAVETDPGGMTVLFGSGTGLQGATAYSPGSRPMGVEAGLLTGLDAAEDLVVLCLGSSNLVVYGNDGSGGLTVASSLYSFGWPGYLMLGDANGDGLLDLLLSRSLTSTVAVFTNLGTGFSSAVSRYVGSQPAALALGLVDGNQTLDLVVALPGSEAVATLPGDGVGGFGYPVTTVVGGAPRLLVAERFNADPHLDVVVTDGSSDTVRLLAGVGDGRFVPQAPFATGDSPSAIRAMDLDGDGILDLAITCSFSHDIWLLWGNEQTP